MRGNGPTELDVYVMYAEELTRCNSSAVLFLTFIRLSNLDVIRQSSNRNCISLSTPYQCQLFPNMSTFDRDKSGDKQQQGMFITYHRVCNQINMTGATGAVTAYPSFVFIFTYMLSFSDFTIHVPIDISLSVFK